MSERYPPGPPNRPFGSNHLQAIRNDLVAFGAELQREFGDVVYFRLGSMDCYQLTHPDQIHEVLVHKARKFRKPKRLKQVFGRFEGNGLVLSEGELWARQRRLVQPAFQPSVLASHAEIVVAATAATIVVVRADRTRRRCRVKSFRNFSGAWAKCRLTMRSRAG